MEWFSGGTKRTLTQRKLTHKGVHFEAGALKGGSSAARERKKSMRFLQNCKQARVATQLLFASNNQTNNPGSNLGAVRIWVIWCISRQLFRERVFYTLRAFGFSKAAASPAIGLLRSACDRFPWREPTTVPKNLAPWCGNLRPRSIQGPLPTRPPCSNQIRRQSL